MRSWAFESRGRVGETRSASEMATIFTSEVQSARTRTLQSMCPSYHRHHEWVVGDGRRGTCSDARTACNTHAARVLHPFGMHAKPMTPQFIVGRIVGMALTFLVVASALLLLGRFAL